MAIEQTAPSRTVSLGAAVLAVAGWGIGPVLVKFVHLPGLAVAFYRLWLGAAIWVALLHLRGGRLRWDVIRRSAPGGIAFGLNVALFFTAVKLTTVTDASIISALQPALVLLVVGRMFGERVTRSDVVWSALAIGGVVLVVAAAGGAGGNVGGDLLAVGALGAWTWYFVASKAARRDLGALDYQTALAVIAAVVVTPVALAAGATPAPHTLANVGWLVAIAVGPGGGHLLMNWAHAHVRLSITSLLTLAAPVISAAGAAVALGEPVAGVQIAGMAITIGALASVVYRMSGDEPHPLPAQVTPLPAE
ncbi:MAG TPA: DMT family transporter [Acidimicrobiales bacterium]|nr:DMT family transporter [Acidimicrobiales bacterium]